MSFINYDLLSSSQKTFQMTIEPVNKGLGKDASESVKGRNSVARGEVEPANMNDQAISGTEAEAKPEVLQVGNEGEAQPDEGCGKLRRYCTKVTKVAKVAEVAPQPERR